MMFSVYGMLSQENGFEKWKKVYFRAAQAVGLETVYVNL